MSGSPTSDRGSPDEINLREIYDLLKAGRWQILWFMVAFMVLALIYGFVATPVYRVSGTVEIDQTSNLPTGNTGTTGSLLSMISGAPVLTNTELEILRSHLVLNPVIDKLGLLVTAVPHYFPIIGAAVARRHAAATRPVTPPAFLGKYAWGGEHIAVSEFEVPQQLDGLPFTLTATRDGYTLTDTAGNKVLSGVVGQSAMGTTPQGKVSLTVADLKARVGETFFVVRNHRQTVLAQIARSLSIDEVRQYSGVIAVSYASPDPQLAKAFVDALEDSYIQQNVARNSEQAQQSLAFLEKQLPDLKAKLTAAQAKLAAYQQKHGAADIQAETGILLNQSVALESQKAQVQQQRLQALIQFTPQHPVVQGLDKQIAEIERQEDALKQKIHKLPETQQAILSLTQDLEVNTQLYTAMLNAIQQFQVSKAGTVGNVRIVDQAMLPLAPVSPRRFLALVACMFVGIFAGVAYVLLRRLLLKGVDDPAEVEQKLGLSVLASVPFAREQTKLGRAAKSGASGQHLLALNEPGAIAIESLRSLRTSLHFAMLDAANQVVMITGPAPGIGKSFVAANFGALLAQTGKRVLVVDADLRKGYLNQYFGLSAEPGLSDYIAGDIALSSVVQESGVPGMSFIARGKHPPNPAELLMHPRFGAMLESLAGEFDHILLDAPPVLAVTDAAIIGKYAATTLLLLKSAEHPMREIEESLKRMRGAGVRVAGVIMNQVGAKAGTYGYGNYGYSYYRYESK